MKKVLLVLFAIIIGINLNTQAEDFSAVNNGATIYYKITSSNSPRTVAVTYRGVQSYTYSNEYSGAVSIPDSVIYNGNYYKVTSINSSAFSGCSGLTSITIPNSVTSIGSSAFYGCTGLTSVTIPNSITSIGSSAFYGCSGLTSITIPNSVISIGDYAFDGCTGLTSITIPNSVTSIGNNAFQSCRGLTSINVDLNNVRYSSINGVLFNKVADTLIKYPMSKSGSYSIPNSVTSIGVGAFYGCTGLASVTIPNSVTSIGISAFSGCTGLTSITIPNSVTSIGYRTFDGCTGLTSINIPNSITSIGDYAFRNCTGLTSITIPNSVTSIGDWVFRNCTGLTSITIPNSVTSIGDYVFYGCSGIDTIICNAIIPPIITSTSFDTIPNNIPIRIPCSSILQYQVAAYWSSFTNFMEQDSCIYSISVLSEDTTKGTVTGGGEFPFSTITITATPKPNCVFLRWNDGNVNSNRIIKATRDSVFTAWFKRIITTNISDSICQGQNYSFFGNNLTTTGLYSHTVQLSSTLDSIVNLSLKVNPRKIININAEICQGETYALNGFNDSIAGLHTLNLLTYLGCDSTVNLNLAVNQPAITNLTAEICQGEFYTLNSFNVSTAGLHTQSLQTTKGCDSIVNLNLIVNPTYLTNYFDTICKAEVYNNFGFNFVANTSGLYTQNLQTIKGCDSTINLNLIVNPTPDVPLNLTINQTLNYFELTWQSNGSSYIIYRNNDSLTTTTMPIYLDYNIVNGQPYCYKVKAINGNCESEFSTVVCKSYVGLNDISSSNITTKLYPNPTNNKSKLEVEGLKSEANVIVSDLLGRVIKSYQINPTMKELEIDVNGFAKGVYNIRIMNDSINQTKKLIVQ